MRKFLLMLMLGGIAGFGFAQDEMMVSEDRSDVAVTGEVGLYSAYVWRGQVVNDDFVAQPQLTLSKGAFSLNVWGNYNVNGRGGQNDFDLSEVDYTFAYALPMNTDDMSIDVGLIHYTFPGVNVDDTDELFVSTVFNNIILTPVLGVYYDVNEVNDDGLYLNLAVSQAVCFSDALCAEVGASAGWGNNNYNSHYFPASGSGMNDYNVYVSSDYKLSENMSLGALLQYTYLDGAQQGNYLADDLVWGGVSVSYSF